MTPAKAYDRAIAAVRDGDADLFARLLAEEYQLWLAVSGDRGPAGGCERAGMAIVAPATRHGASGPGSLPEGDDR
jgi:hypothetical protein